MRVPVIVIFKLPVVAGSLKILNKLKLTLCSGYNAQPTGSYSVADLIQGYDIFNASKLINYVWGYQLLLFYLKKVPVVTDSLKIVNTNTN